MKSTDFEIAASPPFRLDYTVWALRRNRHNQIDGWDGRCYQRIFILDEQPLNVIVEQLTNVKVKVTASPSLSDTLQIRLKQLLTFMLGLDLDLRDFYSMTQRQPALHALVAPFIGFKPPRYPSLFEVLINAVACQQVSLTVAVQLLNNLTRYCGHRLVENGQVFYAFPTPIQIANCQAEELQKLGFSRQRSATLLRLAELTITHPTRLANLAHATNEQVINLLCAIKGIGAWSANYTLLRGLGRLDVFPVNDSGARRSLQHYLHLPADLTYQQVTALTQNWQPYAGLVYFHLLLNKLHEAGQLMEVYDA